MKNVLKRFVKDEQGLELSEYAVMTALIIAVIIGAIVFLRGTIAQRFQQTGNVINSAN